MNPCLWLYYTCYDTVVNNFNRVFVCPFKGHDDFLGVCNRCWKELTNG